MNHLPSPPVRLPGRNDPCWCGSGQKYKRCHLDADAARFAPRSPPRLLRAGRVSPMRTVAPEIPRPDYAATGRPARVKVSNVKTPEQIERLHRACRAAAQVLETTGKAVRPGVTTDALDVIAHDESLRLGAYPSPLNYRGYPKSICTSVNEVICHGIPDDRPLEEGDIVNLDVTVYLDGMHGDTSATFLVGEVDAESKRLVEAARECLARGIGAVRPGRPVSDIGRAIEGYASKQGFGVVRTYCGHGIGELFHGQLQIPHNFDPAASLLMEPGMTFTIEPMITAGSPEDELWDDGWTAVTADGKRSAQFEHTILVSGSGAEILTRITYPSAV